MPDLPVTGEGDDLRFAGCVEGKLKSWVAPFDTAEPGDAYYGYTGPGYVEEFWILDVEGTRLMIAGEQSPGSPAQGACRTRLDPRLHTDRAITHPLGADRFCATADLVPSVDGPGRPVTPAWAVWDNGPRSRRGSADPLAYYVA